MCFDNLHHLALGPYRSALHDDVAHGVVLLDLGPLLLVLLREAHVVAERNRNQGPVAIVVREQFALEIGIEAGVPRKRLGDRLRHQPQEVVRDVVAGRQPEPVHLQFLGERRHGIRGDDVAVLVHVVGNLTERVQQDAVPEMSRRGFGRGGHLLRTGVGGGVCAIPAATAGYRQDQKREYEASGHCCLLR